MSELLNSPMLEAALAYEAKGFSVVPLSPGEKTPWIAWKEFQSRRATPDEIRAWFSERPNSGVGIVCGTVSGGLVVLDYDPRNDDGKNATLEAPHGPKALSGGGGCHVYTRGEGISKWKPATGLDVLGDGALVVAPPSIHPSGKAYEWETNRGLDVLLPASPQWARKPVIPPDEPPAAGGGVTTLLEGVEHGSRNNSAASLAGWACTYTDSPQLAWEFLRLWNKQNKPPLNEDELRRTFLSIAKRHSMDGEDESEAIPERFTKPLSELYATTEQTIPWLVEKLVQEEAIGFIGGDPKQTKSWLALHIAQALATAHPVLGHFHVPRKRRVLYLQEEDSAGLVRNRLDQLTEGHGIPQPEDEYFRYSIRSGLKIDSNKWIARLERECAEFKPELIIADVLNKLHSQDENSQQGMSRVMKGFELIRRGHKTAILIVHHFRKSGGDRGNQSLRGSTVLSGWSENSLYVKRVQTGLYSVEFESKAMAMPAFRYSFQEKKWLENKPAIVMRYGGEEDGTAGLTIADKIIRIVGEQSVKVGVENCTVRHLTPLIDLTENTVRKHLRDLASAGRLKRVKVISHGQEAEAFAMPEEGVLSSSIEAQ